MQSAHRLANSVPVILEGRAEQTTLYSVERMGAACASKYGPEHIDTIRPGPFWAVRPTIVLGFVETPAGFRRSATRWRFPPRNVDPAPLESRL